MSAKPIFNEVWEFYRTLSTKEMSLLSSSEFRAYDLWLAAQEGRPSYGCQDCGSQVEFPGMLFCSFCHVKKEQQKLAARGITEAHAVYPPVDWSKVPPQQQLRPSTADEFRVQYTLQPSDPVLQLIEQYESEMHDAYEGTSYLESKLEWAVKARKALAGSMPAAQEATQQAAKSGTGSVQDLSAGIEYVAAWLDKQRMDFDHENAQQESDTGAWIFRSAHHEEYSNTLAELVDDIRALKGAPTTSTVSASGSAEKGQQNG